jgi:AcrR family transcriptional regulator
MGIAERQERQRAEQRSDILRAARAIASDAGWPSVTVRRIAERIEYSPPVIYAHFASKRDVLQELRRGGFVELARAAARAVATQPGTEARCVALADAYWDFAWDNPELYQLMHDLAGANCGSFSPEECRQMMDAGRNVVGEATGERLGAEPDEAAIVLWAALHGITSLALSGALPQGREQGRQLIRRAARDLFRAWT